MSLCSLYKSNSTPESPAILSHTRRPQQHIRASRRFRGRRGSRKPYRREDPRDCFRPSSSFDGGHSFYRLCYPSHPSSITQPDQATPDSA